MYALECIFVLISLFVIFYMLHKEYSYGIISKFQMILSAIVALLLYIPLLGFLVKV